MNDAQRLRRLKAARLTGRVPLELVHWLLPIAEAAVEEPGSEDSRTTPGERLADDVADEIDRWMSTRGATQRSLDVSRASLKRALRGDSVRLETVAEIANALSCDVRITFVDRGLTAEPTPTAAEPKKA